MKLKSMDEVDLPQGSVALKEKLFPVDGREHSQDSLQNCFNHFLYFTTSTISLSQTILLDKLYHTASNLISLTLPSLFSFTSFEKAEQCKNGSTKLLVTNERRSREILISLISRIIPYNTIRYHAIS